MITSLSGDDKIKINEFIHNAKSQYKRDSIYILDKNSEIKLGNLVNSQGLFFEKKLIIVLNPKTHNELNDENWLAETNENIEVNLIIDLSSLNANLKIFKLIKKLSSKHLNFVQPRDYTFFNLCDAIFLKKDKAEAIKIINSLDNIESQFLPLISILQGSLRNFLSLEYKNETSKSIHPFMAKKISTYKLTQKEIADLYSKLLELDLKSKTQKVDKKALLIDFVLYFL